MLVDADDAALGRHRVHDPHTVAVEQRVELRPERGETPRLDLDELPVRAHEVDHVAVDLDLEGVAGCREERFQVAVKRTFAELSDPRHVEDTLRGQSDSGSDRAPRDTA